MILPEKQRRVLEYIAAVNRGGWRPTGREINEWRRRPERKPRRRGELLEAEVPAIPARRGKKIRSGVLGDIALNPVSSALQAQLRILPAKQLAGMDLSVFKALAASTSITSQLFGEYEMIPGAPGRPAAYGPDRPREKFLRHLRRLGWVSKDAQGRYTVTPLGDALLRTEALSESEEGDQQVTVLAADNELAYGHVLGRISECGEALIVDAYLGSEQLALLIKHTGARRFLVSTKLSKGRLTELAVLIEASPVLEGSARELRQADFHDRWLVGDGKVYGLGASLNGIGKQTTTLVLMPDVTASVITTHAEDLWDRAKTVARTHRPDADKLESTNAGQMSAAHGWVTPSPETPDVHEVDGVFRHSSCTVRHRTRDAATKCRRVAHG